MSDGALRSDVIAVLRERGVDVSELDDEGRVRLSFGQSIVEVVKLHPVVSRTMLSRFERQYGTPVGSFYPAVSRRPHSEASNA